MIQLITSSGQPIRLGREIGRGGEGSVFEVEADPRLVAKIYHSMLPEKAEKIRVMTGLRTKRIEQLTAWPIDLVSGASGEAVGILMPRVSGHQLVHELYNPKSRRRAFARGDWRFLIRAAANTARAFAVVHEAGCVIGDVNHGGILVSDDATVRLIDCDSFQVIVGTHQFLCDVGIETFTPPELQGKTFDGVVRSKNHDNFGLAVLVFLILFMGRHPFAGQFVGQGDMPIGKAIAEGRFAFGPDQRLTQMAKPSGAPNLKIVGKLGRLFEQAFTPVAAMGGRPTAAEWVVALEQLEQNLTHCLVDLSHWYLSSLDKCPWCAIEEVVGIALFPVATGQVPGPFFDIDAFWREIGSISHPGPPPDLPVVSVRPSATALAAGRLRRLRSLVALVIAAGIVAAGFLRDQPGNARWLFVAAAVIAFAAVRLVPVKRKEKAAIVSRQRMAASQWASLRQEWTDNAGAKTFEATLSELERLSAERRALVDGFEKRLDKLRSEQSALALRHYLQDFAIADLAPVGVAQKEILARHDLVSAADVLPEKIMQVPRLGRGARRRLQIWRKSLVRQFVPTDEPSVDRRAYAQLEREVSSQNRKLEEALVAGASRLKATKAEIEAARRSLMAPVANAKTRHLQSLVDRRAVG